MGRDGGEGGNNEVAIPIRETSLGEACSDHSDQPAYLEKV